MFDKEMISERDKFYKKQIQKGTIIKNGVVGLKCAYLGLAVMCGLVPLAEGVDLIHANSQFNHAVELNNAGDFDASNEQLDAMSKYIDNNMERASFSKMSQEDKLAYIENLLSQWAKRENDAVTAGMMGILATIILSRLNDIIEETADYQLDRVIYELYLDEKASPEFKSLFSKRAVNEITDRVKNDPDYSKKQAEDNIAKRSFKDDKPVAINDYNLGFRSGQYDFYSRCNYGSGNIYNKALEYFEKGLDANSIDKKLVEVSYKKGYYRSAGMYIAEKFAQGEELSEEEQYIIDNMDNLSVKNILHINKYNATEVKSRKDYWYGYVDGFKNEIDNKYSSIDFDLSGIDEELKLTVDDALDTNSYKMAFYRGIQDGMRDLRKRVAKMAVNKEQTI